LSLLCLKRPTKPTQQQPLTTSYLSLVYVQQPTNPTQQPLTTSYLSLLCPATYKPYTTTSTASYSSLFFVQQPTTRTSSNLHNKQLICIKMNPQQSAFGRAQKPEEGSRKRLLSPDDDTMTQVSLPKRAKMASNQCTSTANGEASLLPTLSTPEAVVTANQYMS
jgi:hypothetical protein